MINYGNSFPNNCPDKGLLFLIIETDYSNSCSLFSEKEPELIMDITDYYVIETLGDTSYTWHLTAWKSRSIFSMLVAPIVAPEVTPGNIGRPWNIYERPRNFSERPWNFCERLVRFRPLPWNIGATLGATLGATIGAGKHLAKWLIISGRCKRCHQTSVLHVYVRERECFAHKCTITMFATWRVTTERWRCAEEGFVLMTMMNLSATLREPSSSSKRW